MKVKKPSKVLNTSLWASQIILALALFSGTYLKVFMSIDALSEIFKWAGEIPPSMVRFTGVVDFFGGLGLILPIFPNVSHRVAGYAGISIVALMVCASIFHISRGETSDITTNIIFAILSIFIAWGRLKKKNCSAQQFLIMAARCFE